MRWWNVYVFVCLLIICSCLCLYVCVYVFYFIWLSFLSIRLFVCLFESLSICLWTNHTVCLPVYSLVCLFVPSLMFVCRSIYLPVCFPMCSASLISAWGTTHNNSVLSYHIRDDLRGAAIGSQRGAADTIHHITKQASGYSCITLHSNRWSGRDVDYTHANQTPATVTPSASTLSPPPSNT